MLRRRIFLFLCGPRKCRKYFSMAIALEINIATHIAHTENYSQMYTKKGSCAFNYKIQHLSDQAINIVTVNFFDGKLAK